MKKILVLFIAMLIVARLFAQQVQFIHQYGDLCPDFGLSIDNTIDGGYILLGHTQNYGAAVEDLFLVKLDSLGLLQWQQLYGGIDADAGQSVMQTSDKGFILCGFTKSFGAGGYDIYLVKTDSSGAFQWQQTYGGANDDFGYCVKQTRDLGYIICGSTKSFGAGNTDAILIKTDTAGVTQWTKYFGGLSNDGSYSLDTTSDGGFVLAGYTYNFGAVLDDAMLIKTDAAGNQQWMELFGGSGNDRALSVRQYHDGGYCFAGYTNSYGSGNYDAYLVKTDTGGIQEFDKTFGGSQADRAYSIDITAEQGFILCGYTDSYGAGGDDLYVVNTDSTGNLNWQHYFGTTQNEEGFTIKTTPDHGSIAIGNTIIGATSYPDVYVVKMDTAGAALSVIHYFGLPQQVIVCPNPADDKLTIENEDMSVEHTFSLCNIQGQILMQGTLQHINTILDVSLCPSGLYFVCVNSSKGVTVTKIIIE
jgi:hypothetical protein